MKKTILLTGATGFVGTRLADQLQQTGDEIICISRQPRITAGNDNNIRYVQIPDISSDTDWSILMGGLTHIIHCAARVHVMNEICDNPLAIFRQANVDATVNLARQAAAAGVKQFIFISSVKVNGEHTSYNHAFTEDSKPHPEDAYGISKYEAELALLDLGRETNMAITIIRPPLVYGPGVKANFLSMLKWVQKRVPLPLASINNRRSFVYIDNLVSLILTCIDQPKAAQQIFLVSDGQDLSTSQLLQYCAKALDVSPRLWPCPPSLLMYAARLIRRKSVAERLCQSLQVDITKAKRLLDWTPPFTPQEGLRVTADAFKDIANKG